MSSTINDSASSGMLGAQVSVRNVGSKLVVKSRPKQRRNGNPSGKLLKAQNRFDSAVQYGKQQASNPESSALYARGITDKMRSVYMVALNDYLVKPQVLDINTLDYSGAKGDIITVEAKDDFMVKRVKIVITDATGTKIEEGEATGTPQTAVGQWEYKAKTANPALAGTTIKAIAFDLPGNRGILEVKL